MRVTIDIESEEPLFAQLVGQIKQAVQASKLEPEQALPSIRQLASDLSLNNKTVAKAYKLLERDGVIQPRVIGAPLCTLMLLKTARLICQLWFKPSLKTP